MPSIKLLIFDLDGTLIDSLSDLTRAVNHMLDGFSRPHLVPEEVRKLVGKGARYLVERALPGSSEEEIQEALRLFLDYNLAHIADETRPYPGVPETLDALKAKGFTICVLSNKNVALCREVLEKLGLADRLQAIFGADSFPYRKPSPEPVLALLKEYRVQAHEAAIIGDSINDVAAGRDAGILTIGCRYGYGEDAELAGASHVVAELPELLRILN